MIRPVNINLNAAHPELPLVEATTFTGAPSSVFIRGVPKSVGNWSITAVSVAVTFPDNTTTARAAVESAEGVWVATIPGTATSGRTAAGFRILADGIDENGAAVTGYVLGFADFSVFSFLPVPAPGETYYLLRYFDTMPTTPKEGDVAKIDGVLKFYNGSAWEPFAAPVTLDDAVTRTSANGVKSSGIWSAIWGALAALPTGFTSLYDWCVSQLAGKANDDAVVKLTGDQDIGGNKTFYGDVAIVNEKDLDVQGGRVAVRSSGGSDVALFEYDRLEYSTDGGMTWTSITLDNIAPLASPAFTGTPTAPTPSSGDDSTKVATTAFVQGAVPYTLVTKTISNGAVSLDDRAINAVAVSSSLASLTVNFPTATSGRVRDFGLRLTVASGITTAPELALPQGVVCENADGAAPEVGADGAATILYFTETAANVFLVKGEVVTAIS